MLPAPSGPQPAVHIGLLGPHSCVRAALSDLSPPACPRACKRGQPAKGVSSAPALRKNRAGGTLCPVGLGCKQLWGNNEKTATPGELEFMSWGCGKSTIVSGPVQAGSRASQDSLLADTSSSYYRPVQGGLRSPCQCRTPNQRKLLL